MRVLVLGLDNAGKTTVVKRLIGEPVDTISPTLGFQIHTLDRMVNGQTVKLNFWDIGGQKTIRAYWRNYFESTDGIIWVVDSSDDRWKQSRMELASLLQEPKLQGSSLVVLANKQDLNGAKSSQDLEIAMGLKELRGRRCKVFGVSAYKGDNVEEALNWLITEIHDRLFLLD